jgi:hypothetical protein
VLIHALRRHVEGVRRRNLIVSTTIVVFAAAIMLAVLGTQAKVVPNSDPTVARVGLLGFASRLATPAIGSSRSFC